MIKIHVVLEGETIYSIAKLYEVSADRLISENELVITEDLVPGQTIVISYPEQIYVVQQGDSLLSIANTYGISLIELYRNNPYLADRKFIYPGQTIVISYGSKRPLIATNGYTTTLISDEILRKTLPFLTYLSIFGHNILEDGSIEDIDDDKLLQTSKSYGVATLMVISAFSQYWQENIDLVYSLLNDEALTSRFIDNVIIILKNKGYNGLNITYHFLTNSTLSAYEKFHSKIYHKIKSEGFTFFVTIAPNMLFKKDGITFEEINYSNIMKEGDGVVLLNYSWGSYFGPPLPLASIGKISDFISYIEPQVCLDKVFTGLPLIAYNWRLPYRVCLSKANALTLERAVSLAGDVGATILFDESSQTPYYTYNESIFGVPREHIVWFIDARSIDSLLQLVEEKGMYGSGMWNIVIYYPQLWLVMNAQYDIVRIKVQPNINC